eukprot:3816434-Amphidinium_carterae.1
MSVHRQRSCGARKRLPDCACQVLRDKDLHEGVKVRCAKSESEPYVREATQLQQECAASRAQHQRREVAIVIITVWAQLRRVDLVSGWLRVAASRLRLGYHVVAERSGYYGAHGSSNIEDTPIAEPLRRKMPIHSTASKLRAVAHRYRSGGRQGSRSNRAPTVRLVRLLDR